MSDDEAPVSYNAVAPVYGDSAAAPAPEPEEDPNAPPLTGAAARLAQLKKRLSGARNANHKAVVAEDKKNKLGADGAKAERMEKLYEKKKAAAEAAGGKAEPTAEERMLEMTAKDARDRLYKDEKKEKRRGEYGWDVFNNEAQYRHYKKKMRRSDDEGRLAGAVDDGDEDPLAYGQAKPVPAERVEALVEDMHEAALRRASWSRRRTFNEDKDVTYINKARRRPPSSAPAPRAAGAASCTAAPPHPQPPPPRPPAAQRGVQQEDRARIRPVHGRAPSQPRARHGPVRAALSAHNLRLCGGALARGRHGHGAGGWGAGSATPRRPGVRPKRVHVCEHAVLSNLISFTEKTPRPAPTARAKARRPARRRAP